MYEGWIEECSFLANVLFFDSLFFLLRIRFCRLVNVNQTLSALMNNKCAVN